MRFGVKALTITVMVLSTVMVTLFGQHAADLHAAVAHLPAAGFCTNAAIVGMYAIFAQAFPTHVRASGTGFAVGVGRGGSVLAPIIAGFLFTSFSPADRRADHVPGLAGGRDGAVESARRGRAAMTITSGTTLV